VGEFALVAVRTHFEQFLGNWIVKDKIAVEEPVVELVCEKDEKVGEIEQK
jgi:hypothetical protein